MIVYKYPTFDEDSFYFVIEERDVLKPEDSQYYKVKRLAFENKVTNPDWLKEFKEGRPSLRFIEDVTRLDATIYTVSSEMKNQIPLDLSLTYIRRHFKETRRCVLNFSDTLRTYLDDSKDSSCLLAIHYYNDSAKLIFRASDMASELLIDLHLIKEFFLDPVFEGSAYEIHVFSSTSQNIINPKNLVKGWK